MGGAVFDGSGLQMEISFKLLGTHIGLHMGLQNVNQFVVNRVKPKLKY